MGSSCSTRQSSVDSSSEQDVDGLLTGEKEATKSSQHPKSQKAASSTTTDSLLCPQDKKGAVEKVQVRIVESEFSSCGDEGALAGTPLSSSVSAAHPNGSTRRPGGDSSLEETKGNNELPHLDSFTDHTRCVLEGKYSQCSTLRKENKVCVFLIANLSEYEKSVEVRLSSIGKEISQLFDAKGIEAVVIDFLGEVPPLKSPLSTSDLLSDYVKDLGGIKSAFIFFLPNADSSPLLDIPSVLTDSQYSSLLGSFGEENGDILQRRFRQDDLDLGSSLWKLCPPLPLEAQPDLMSEDEEKVDEVFKKWRLDYERLNAALGRTQEASKTSSFVIPKLFDKILDILEGMPKDVSMKVVILSDSVNPKPLEEGRGREFVESVEHRPEFDVMRRKLKAKRETLEWTEELISTIESSIGDSVPLALTACRKLSLNPSEEGIKGSLLEEISAHFNHTLRLRLRGTLCFEEYLAKVRKHVLSSCKSPLLVVGNEGSGKTQLIAQVATHCRDWLPECVAVVRYIGLTDNCTTLQGLFCFLNDHLTLTHGTPSPSKNFHDVCGNAKLLLERACEERPIVVLLDGVDEIAGDASSTSAVLLDILKELPPNVRMVVSARENSPFHLELKQNEAAASFVKIEGFDVDQSDKFLRNFLSRSDSADKVIQAEDIRKTIQTPLAPLYLLILSQALLTSGAVGKKELRCSSDLEQQVHLLTESLKKLFHLSLLRNLVGCLASSRAGLLESELLSIIRSSTPSSHVHCSVLDWLLIKRILWPVLRIKSVNGLVFLSFSTSSIKNAFVKSICGSGKKANEVWTEFCETNFIETSDTSANLISKDVISLSHLRFVQEKASAPCDPLDPENLFSAKWIMNAIDCCGIFKVLEELEGVIDRHPANNRELLVLREILVLSQSSLVYDPSQFYCQIYGRLKWRLKDEKNCDGRLAALLRESSKPSLPSLIPLSSSCFFTSLEEATNASDDSTMTTMTHIDSLFRLPKDPNHIISISSGRSEVAVWNIFSMKVVRTLKGINQPRDLQMIDDYKCLLLCGRELRIYDLNEGTFLMKLREVMNQKMPFFGLHNSEHVVALSRNRMYLNMMNLNEGTCVSTFKVGEDRFLNSLIVSENGKICVCGDDSQKPSHLLVWDLQMRKLLYDLRIPHHEFLTKYSAITTEGHYVGCVCKEVDERSPNFIVVYDLQSGTLFKRWKPEVNTVSISISTAVSSVVVGLENFSLMAFDLITGNRRWTVFGHSAPPDTLKLDSEGAVLLSLDSFGVDRSLRVWNIQTGKSLATLTLDKRISACEITYEGKAVSVVMEGNHSVSTFLLPPHTQVEDPTVNESSVYGNPDFEGKVVDFS